MKKPKMPKANSSLQTWKNYEQKLKDLAEKKTIIDRVRTKRSKL